MDNTQILQQAITAIKKGDRGTGQKLLLSLVKANPNNETAWLWLSITTDDIAKKRQCLEQVLAINPNNETAKRGLVELQKQVSQPKQIEVPRVETPSQQAEPLPKANTVSSTQPSQVVNLQPIDKPEIKEQVGATSELPPKKPISPKPLKAVKQEATRKCPYCAETIKAEAKFCRFCGKELKSPPLPQQLSMANIPTKTEHAKSKQQSVGRTIYHIFAFVVIVGFLGCVGLSILSNLDTVFSPYGEKLEYNGGEVYYTSRVHKDAAEKVGVFLMEVGYFNSSRQNDPVAVQIDYAEEQFQVKFIFVPGVEKDETSDSYLFATNMGTCLAYAVFGEPITFHFAGSTFRSLKTVELRPSDRSCRIIRGY